MARARSEAASEAIAAATVQLLEEGGYARLTMGDVAARAGVGKDTLYRRHRSKADLVHAVLFGRHHPPHVPPPDTGSLAGDVRAIVQQLVDVITTPIALDAIPGLLGDGFADDALVGEVRASVYGPLRQGFATVLERAQARGDAVADAPAPELVADVLAGAVLFRCAFAGVPAGPDLPTQLARLVELGLAPRGAPCPPSAAPSAPPPRRRPSGTSSATARRGRPGRA